MNLTNKDFIELAKTLKSIFAELDLVGSQEEVIFGRIADWCSSQNGFDINKFKSNVFE